jgi:hypothetical protein
MKACGLSSSVSYMPSRRTLDRRLKTISTDIKERITAIGNWFVLQDMVNPYILAVDSTLLRSKGKVWHKSSMEKGIVPRSGIDTDARWGFSYTRGWIFGYKLHMICSTDSLIVPLTADVTTANMSDNQVYPDLTTPSSFSGLSSEITTKADYMVADPGYDDQSLYESSLKMGFQLVCPIHRYKNTSEERLQLVDFYESPLGQAIYSKRRISVEPLIEHIKSIFRIDPVTTRGFDNVRGIVLLSVLLYQTLVYYSCKMQKDSPRRAIKYMIGC